MSPAPVVPVVDLGPTVAAGRPVGDVAAQVDRACREVGFFAVTGHGFPDELRAEVLAQARRFFALPDAVKQEVAIERSPNNRGYGGFGAELLQPDLPPDNKETFDIGPEPGGPGGGDPSPLSGANQWPALDGFREPLVAYQAMAIETAVLLMRVVAEALDLPTDHFDACLERPIVNLRLLRYPEAPADAPVGQLGAGAHTDYGCLTLLYGDGTPGLQLRRVDGTWVDVEVPPEAVVVNLGDLLQRWTNDRYRSTPHRVLPPVGRERYSVPVFVNPAWDTVVSCLPACLDEGAEPRYPPVLAGEYLRSRFAETFAYLAPPAD